MERWNKNMKIRQTFLVCNHFKNDLNVALWTNPNKAKVGQLFHHDNYLPLVRNTVQPHAFSLLPKNWHFPMTCREMSAAGQLHCFTRSLKWHAELHILGKFMESHFYLEERREMKWIKILLIGQHYKSLGWIYEILSQTKGKEHTYYIFDLASHYIQFVFHWT